MSNSKDSKVRDSAAEAEPAARRRFLLGALAAVPAAALLGACADEGAAADVEELGDDETLEARRRWPWQRRDAATPPATRDAGTSTRDAGTTSPGTSTPPAGDAGAPTHSNTCTVYPRQTEGPYYLKRDLVRANITEGKPGTPLKLTIQVLKASGCAPLAGVAVDVWHADAAGVYSGYRGQLGGLDTTGQTFMRGTQETDAAGQVTFQTVYPGWYPGRAVHIHFKVHFANGTEATSQIYFPDEVSTEVYKKAPYSTHTGNRTLNGSDTVNRGGQVKPATVVPDGAGGYAINLTVTVA